jgi:ABC-2 type transport system permease protein
MIRLIAARELRSLFAAPSTWFVLAALQFIFAWFFLSRLDSYLQVQSQLAQIANAPGATLAIAAPLTGSLSLMLMMLVPLFTMRSIAEERRNQTWPLLLAAPVSSIQIILGKFIGLVLFFALVICVTMLMLASLALGTALDVGLLLSNALGLMLLMSSFAALGLYLSALTKQPAVAAMSTFAALFGLWLIDNTSESGSGEMRAIAPTMHFQTLNTGFINSSDLFYFVLFVGVFLTLAVRSLERER